MKDYQNMLNRIYMNCKNDKHLKDDYKGIQKLVERATPIKALENGGCPKCDNKSPEYADSFCTHCGQALLHNSWLDDIHKEGIDKVE